MIVGIRDDADLESVVARIADRQTHAVDCDAAFVHTKISALCHLAVGRVLERKAVAAVFAYFVDTHGGIVHVALYDVAVQAPVHHH